MHEDLSNILMLLATNSPQKQLWCNMQHFYVVDMLHLAQRYIHNVLSRCHCNNSYANASQFYVIRLSSICSCLLSYRPPVKMTTAGFPETSVPTKLRHFTSYKPLMFSLPSWLKANQSPPRQQNQLFFTWQTQVSVLKAYPYLTCPPEGYSLGKICKRWVLNTWLPVHYQKRRH